MSDYRKQWKSYRLRFWTTLAAWLIPPVLIYLFSTGGRSEIGLIAAWLLLFTVAMVWLFSFRCPRCGEWFFIKLPSSHPLTRVCVHCGLHKYADEDEGESEHGERGI